MKPTPSIRLRELTVQDAAAVFEITGDPEAAKYMRFDVHTSLEQARQLVEEYRLGGLAFAVLSPSGEFVGYLAMHASDEEPGCYGMSTMIAPRFWNQGYGTAMVAAAKEMAMDPDSPVRALTGHVVGDNLGSRRMLEKNGFTVAQKITFEDLPSGLYVYRFENTRK